jgi:hypothetical protein
MINIGDTLDNRTICDVLGVANTGGIRVNNSRNLMVVISNNTKPTYRNEWKDDVLHFVGMGSTGPQKLDRQNRTLAYSKRNGMAVHLFEVFEKSKYVYAGEVELADEPYVSDQQDAAGDGRFVWVFPLRKKTNAALPTSKSGTEQAYLPYGAYAVIDADLHESHVALVHDAIDRLREAGVKIRDQRDVDLQRYERALTAWHEAVLDRVRRMIKELIAKRKRLAKRENREFKLIDDELRINAASTEKELRDALSLLDRDDAVVANQVFDEAMRSVPAPKLPKSLRDMARSEPMLASDIENARAKRLDPARFRDFT